MAASLTATDRRKLDSGVGIWRDAALVTVSGTDVADFLQGYLTCDTQALDERRLHPMALCNVQGRVVANGWVSRITLPAAEVRYALLVHRSVAERVAAFLTPFARFARCTVAVAPELQVLITPNDIGPDADGPRPFFEDLHLWYAQDYSGTKATRSFDVGPIMQRLLVQTAFAWVSAEVGERFLPHNLGLVEAGAVDFDKGCYLGQEIIARIQFRGAVKRSLGRFSWQKTPPQVGHKLNSGATVVMVAVDSDVDATQVTSGTGLAVS